MNKVFLPLLLTISIFGSSLYTGSTKAVVVLVGAQIKAKNIEIIKKYPRKDCPVCHGTGWYLSGDGIKRVECGYCEAEKKSTSVPNKECKTQVIKK